MELLLKREEKNANYTIGRLYANGVYVCDTLEDTERSVKIKGLSAIPIGCYKVAMSIKSPKYSNFTRYKWAKSYDGKLPRLLDVPGFEGILIHVGNTVKDTSGCILVGCNTMNGTLRRSTETFKRLMDEYLVPAAERNETIIIKIE